NREGNSDEVGCGTSINKTPGRGCRCRIGTLVNAGAPEGRPSFIPIGWVENDIGCGDNRAGDSGKSTTNQHPSRTVCGSINTTAGGDIRDIRVCGMHGDGVEGRT